MTKLAGLVAILTPAGDAVLAVRDLGPVPVEVKPNVLRLSEQTVDLSTGPDTAVDTTHVITPGVSVVRTTTIRDSTALEIAERRDGVAAQFDAVENVSRAAALVIMDELNLHSARLASILSGVAAAGTFAAFKTAMAAIQAIPQRTPAQIRASIRSKLGS